MYNDKQNGRAAALELSSLIVLDRLHDLLSGIHHKGSMLYHWLVDRLTTNDNKSQISCGSDIEMLLVRSVLSNYRENGQSLLFSLFSSLLLSSLSLILSFSLSFSFI